MRESDTYPRAVQLNEWRTRHGPEQTWPAIEGVMKALGEQGVKEFAAIGFCFGARYVFDLSFRKSIKVGGVAHPSMLQVPDDVDKMKDCGVPCLIV